MKKALLVIAALLCNLLLESIVFVRINLWGLLPDSIIAVVATIALVGGGRKAGALWRRGGSAHWYPLWEIHWLGGSHLSAARPALRGIHP